MGRTAACSFCCDFAGFDGSASNLTLFSRDIHTILTRSDEDSGLSPGLLPFGGGSCASGIRAASGAGPEEEYLSQREVVVFAHFFQQGVS